MAKSTLHLDLHPIAKQGAAIDEALTELFAEATAKRVKTAEIIPGKGSGQLMKRVKKWLDQKHVKAQYKRVEVDSNNHGRLFVHFR
ncbi:MAG TPA: Smr/MutS family protein [Candidatus Paceibacterota bacterium]|nr:Smr/MutS family protein [Candidatus Paceibacterota bacterium]